MATFLEKTNLSKPKPMQKPKPQKPIPKPIFVFLK